MAGSIKLLQFFQKFNQTIGICAYQSNRNQHTTKLIQTIFLIFYAQIMFTTIAFLSFDAKSMFDYGYVFFALVTTINGIAIYLIFIWQSENTLEFIGNCEEFIKKRSQLTAAYNGLIGKIELFNKFLCFGMLMTVVFVSTVAPYSFVRYFIFDMGEDSFYLFYPAWFPFDWKTPFGYLVAWLAQCASGTCLTCIDGQFLNLVLGSCWIFIFIAEDITRDVAELNITAKTVSDKDRTKLKKRFCDMIQIYSDAKQCVMEFNRVFKYSLFSFFAWDMLGLSSFLATAQFELWADDPNSFEIALLILVLIWLILFLFILCEPGARMTNKFEEFSDKLNQCNWYLLPMDLQRYYLIFVSDTQNPVNVMSYANILCKRETSKKIINTAFSYFMTLRRFKT